MHALIAIGIINVLLILPLWWRDGVWGSVWLVSKLGQLPLLALWPGAHRARWPGWLLAIFFTLVFAALLGDELVRALFSRPLNILLDHGCWAPTWIVRGARHLD